MTIVKQTETTSQHGMQADKQAGRQAGRQAGSQSVSQTARQTEENRHYQDKSGGTTVTPG